MPSGVTQPLNLANIVSLGWLNYLFTVNCVIYHAQNGTRKDRKTRPQLTQIQQ